MYLFSKRLLSVLKNTFTKIQNMSIQELETLKRKSRTYLNILRFFNSMCDSQLMLPFNIQLKQKAEVNQKPQLVILNTDTSVEKLAVDLYY